MTSRRLVTDYVKFRLEKDNLSYPITGHQQYNLNNSNHSNKNEIPNGCNYQQLLGAIQTLCTEFEQRYDKSFEGMINQIHIAHDNAKDSFMAVINELFIDGVKWGRIIALFAFAGAISVQCLQKELPGKVEEVVDWTSNYIDVDIKAWFDENDGWNGFIDFYKSISNDREGFWNKHKVLLTRIAGVAAIGAIGTFLLKR